MANFVHLHNHSHYSLLDGACRIDDMIGMALENDMSALALTDHGNMFGAIEFYTKAQSANIKPIIGVEVYIAPQSRLNKSGQKGKDTSYHFLLLAKDFTGYKNLLKLVTIGYLEGFYYKPRIDREVLKQFHEGLIGLTACIHGEIPTKIIQGDYQSARQTVLEYQEIFGDDFYLEVQNHGIPEEETALAGLKKLSRELNIPLVATNDIHYLKREHAIPHDVLLCLQTGKDYDDPNRLRYATQELYFKSSDEMFQLFSDLTEAVENTLEVAEKCNLELEFDKFHLPQYELPDDASEQTLDEYLERLALEGLRWRYSEITPEIEQRLRNELNIIKQTGYAGYFLIVKDFIDYARKKGIPVGPGRGSAAGSLVAYALGITNIDPLRYNLIFERFLNPERITLPDIDIDFCYERREKIIDYVKKKYGDKNVTQIITFGTMAARAVIRDVGRVLKMKYNEVDRIAKLIPFGKNLDEAIALVPEFRQLSESEDETYRKLIDYSRVLEGLARHASTHAAGVVIAPAELTNFVPLYKTNQGDVTTQYDMKCIEKIGLLKMDFLGLRTLTVIDNTIKLLKKRNIEIDIDKIPLDDVDTYKLFSNGETVGVFQFESSGMRECLRKLKPECIEDLIAMNALFRPGPMVMIDDFIDRKHGRKPIEYLHPSLEPILKETYGVIVYQEQVIQIASKLAGFSMGEADVLRRAMGKKNPKAMQQQLKRFVEGANKNGIPTNIAEEIFDLMSRFAGYGFNKSHAAGYALVAYQTAYLKTHYPAEFMAASFSSEMGNTDRIMVLMEECRRMGIKVLPPDVNESFTNFVVTEEGIRFGLGAIKNVGKGAIESIVRARKKHGKFQTIFDFVQHLDLRLVNRKVLESLIQAGAMDSLQGHRAQLMAAVGTAINFAQSQQSASLRRQTSIFDVVEDSGKRKVGKYPDLPIVERWSPFTKLAKEKELLGFYISGHPLAKFEEELQAFSTVSLEALNSLQDGALVKVGGIITSIKTHHDRNQRIMAFVKLEDFSGSCEVLVFSDAYEKNQGLIKIDSMVMLIGQVSTRENENAKIICREILPLTEARERFAKNVCVNLNFEDINDEMLGKIKKLVQKNKGECFFLIHLINGDQRECLIRSQKFRVSPQENFISQLRQMLGKQNVWIEG
ncbi:DNA polymerase III subunit alpha [bacterium]|nr:DNA polymerase III subunit alpha [bacterium]